MDKNHLQGLKNLRKTIFNVLETNLDENLIFEKKSQNLPSNTEIFDIFEILKFVWWPEMADDRLKIGRKVRSKLFVTKKNFDRQTQKFMILIQKTYPPKNKKSPFWGRGGKLFLMFWKRIQTKISFLKKKSQNLPSNTEIFDILQFVWWTEMADDRLKIVRKERSKLFCHQKKNLTAKLKNS